ncbi:MAG: biotin--[acetyl-CoA-carboxylase] ligase [Ignavibacteria bacterium]|nr:biotin--[acetyl-CoA-carboxylase] ligase [Ignavibacteria bacterium]
MSTITPIEFHLPSVTSTNDYAKELLRTYPYVFVSALHQTNGRGRKGRIWHGDFGANVYCSIGIKHTQPQSVQELSIFMAKGALAALKVVRMAAPNTLSTLKYPNDVISSIDGEWYKIAGTIVEHEFQGGKCESTIVGIGINVDQVEFPDTITQRCTSLRLLGADADLSNIINLLKKTYTELQYAGVQKLYENWVHELNIVGKSIRIFSENGIWIVVRVQEDGRLVARNVVTQIERTVSDVDTIRYED